MPATAELISLSDDQLSAIMTACAPLDVHRRSAFLVALAQMLRSEPQPIGDGSLGRAVRALQHEFRDPMSVHGPTLGRRSKLNSGPPIYASARRA